MPEDFEKILEESFEDPEVMRILKEKAAASEKKRTTVGEVVKGYPGPQREVDLHGKTSAEATIELKSFIRLALQHGVRTVRVITGKGLHSEGMKSVLPQLTEQILSVFKRDNKVLSFRREKTGGSFVVYLNP